MADKAIEWLHGVRGQEFHVTAICEHEGRSRTSLSHDGATPLAPTKLTEIESEDLG